MLKFFQNLKDKHANEKSLFCRLLLLSDKRTYAPVLAPLEPERRDRPAELVSHWLCLLTTILIFPTRCKTFVFTVPFDFCWNGNKPSSHAESQRGILESPEIGVESPRLQPLPACELEKPLLQQLSPSGFPVS